MGLSITINDATHKRVTAVPDLHQKILELQENARRSGVLDELVHLRAVDPYGDTIFNWLQVKRLLDDVRRAASVAPGDPAVDQLIDELEKGCADVLDYHWYVHVIGD